MEARRETMRERKMRIARHRFVEKVQGAIAILTGIAGTAPTKQIARAKKEIVSVEIARRMHLETGLFAWRKIGAQGERNPTRQFGLEREKVGDLAIVGVVPNVEVCPGVDQLRVDPDSIRLAPYRPFHYISNDKRFADIEYIASYVS